MPARSCLIFKLTCATVPALLIGCGTLGTYYPRSGADPVVFRPLGSHRPQQSIVDTTQSAASDQDRQAPASTANNARDEKWDSTASVELSPEILPVTFESESDSSPQATPDEEPPGVPLPEPAADVKPREADSMTLQQLESLALQHNPSIQQASTAARKASGLQSQVGLKPNPRIGYFAQEMGSNSSAGLQGAFVNQTFVTGGKLEANRRVLAQDYQSVLWEVETQRYRVRTDVRINFFETLAAQRRLEIAADFYEVADKGREVAQLRLDALEGSKPDVLQAEIQFSEIEIIRRKAEVEYQAAWKDLVTVVGLPEMQPVSLDGELPEQLEERQLESLYQQVLNSSPELQAAYARLNAARANLKRQDVQPLPNITGQVGVGRDNGNGNDFANVQLSLPLPLHNRNQGNIQAAYADYCRASQDVARLKLAIRSRLIDALRDYNLARVSVDQFANVILPKAKESLDLSEQAYVAGQFGFLRVLEARRTYYETNLSFVQARADLATADARIEGLLLSGGLNAPASYDRDDTLRGRALTGQ